MQTQQIQSPWLQAAAKLQDELREQPPEVQQVMRQLSRKQYPESKLDR